jgi:hypothetical protein
MWCKNTTSSIKIEVQKEVEKALYSLFATSGCSDFELFYIVADSNRIAFFDLLFSLRVTHGRLVYNKCITFYLELPNLFPNFAKTNQKLMYKSLISGLFLVGMLACGDKKKEGPAITLGTNLTFGNNVLSEDSAALYKFKHLNKVEFMQYSAGDNLDKDTVVDILDANWHDVALKIDGKWHVFNDSAALETLINAYKSQQKKLNKSKNLEIKDNHGNQTISF